jgi:GT2 family glycosyltransferase
MLISVVVLSHGAPDLALECLESIEMADQRAMVELILVDNGSTPEEKSDLNTRLNTKGIRLNHFVSLVDNVGFSRGMNAGIALAQGDLVIALNSDTLVGCRVPSLLSSYPLNDADRVGFLAVPVFDAGRSLSGLKKTRNLQADVSALTWYMSCMPARASDIQPRYVLGPPGPAVIMTRAFINELIARYGFVYDPAFFFYGEDVDLFLRARRGGYRTQLVRGSVDREEVIWHVGSATVSNAGVRTINKPPEVAARVLEGCLRNARSHAGALEYVPVLLCQMCFRFAFWASYAWRNSLSSTIQLVLKSRVIVPRSYEKRPAMLFLTGLISVLYRRPSFWARRTPGVSKAARVSTASI